MAIKDTSGKSSYDIINLLRQMHGDVTTSFNRLYNYETNKALSGKDIGIAVDALHADLVTFARAVEEYGPELTMLRYDDRASAALRAYRDAAVKAGEEVVYAMRYMATRGDHSYEPSAIMEGTTHAVKFATESNVDAFIASVKSAITGENLPETDD